MPGPLMACLKKGYDVARLRADVNAFADSEWVDIRSGGVSYETGWRLLPLRSRGGDERDGSAGDVGTEPFENTPLLDRAPYVREILWDLDCELWSVRLSSLRPAGSIDRHQDHEVRLEKDHPVRLHIPIVNDDAELYLDGHACRWPTGQLWYGDFSRMHSAHNYAATPRVHLLIVAVVNDWLLSLFSEGLL